MKHPAVLCVLALLLAGASADVFDNNFNPGTPPYKWAKPSDANGWAGQARKYALEARNNKGAYKMLWYGDSLVDCLRFDSQICPGNQKAYSAFVGRLRVPSVVWGLGSDTMDTLMYRMMNGISPKGMGAKVAVFMIGTNDIGKSNQDLANLNVVAQRVAAKTQGMAKFLTASDPKLNVVVLALPGRLTPGWQNQNKAIQWVNARLKYRFSNPKDRIFFMDCNPRFLYKNGVPQRKYLTDTLHYNGAAWTQVFNCIEPTIRQLLK